MFSFGLVTAVHSLILHLKYIGAFSANSLAKTIYAKSAHQNYKRKQTSNWDSSMESRKVDLTFDATIPSWNLSFSDPILLHFPIAYNLGKAFILNKINKNSRKVEIKFLHGN